MPEPPQLLSAREHLARAEATWRSAGGLRDLEQGLSLLDEVMSDDASDCQTLARNLGSTYAAIIIERVHALVESDRGAPEPELEHLFKLVLAFDEGDFDRPANARSLKINLARRLIDRYYEGHAPAEKHAALEQLARISNDGRQRARGERTTAQRKRSRQGSSRGRTR